MAAGSAVVLAFAVLVAGPLAVAGLTDLPSVRSIADAYLPLTTMYMLVSFAAFQLDGIFIGATGSRPMRNASIASNLVFIGGSVPAIAAWGNLGVWPTFIGYVVVRAVFLGVYLPGLRRRVDTAA